MEIFETGFADPSDPEELRITAVLSRLEEHGVSIKRHSRRSLPEMSTGTSVVGNLVSRHGVSVLPVTLVNGFAMITGRYPSNEEIRQILNLPKHFLEPKREGCYCIQGYDCREKQP